MDYFKYQHDFHEAWSCFADYEGVEPHLKHQYEYEFVDEIMKACKSGAINRKTFNLHNYTSQCWMNEKRDRIKASARCRNLVPDLHDGEVSTGYGDITEGQAYAINSSYENNENPSEEERVLNQAGRDYHMARYEEMAKTYLHTKGIDIKYLITESLKGNRKVTEILKGYVQKDARLASLIKTLCTECQGSLI